MCQSERRKNRSLNNRCCLRASDVLILEDVAGKAASSQSAFNIRVTFSDLKTEMAALSKKQQLVVQE